MPRYERGLKKASLWLRASLANHMNNNNLCYEFGPYQLDSCKRILTREGEGIPLTPKATEILMALVKHAGQLVEKDELLKEVWPDTFVEENNLTQNIFTLRKALGDDRTDPKYIETVARRGYRFLATVRTVSQVANGDSWAQPTGVPHSPVVAVLPFINNTGDPELDYLADGITSNLINSLSRMAQLRVMSRTTVLRYNVNNIDLQQMARELGINTFLVGKINAWHGYSNVSVNVEVVNAHTGWHLWGEDFDFQCRDLLQIEDAITRHLMAALKLKLSSEDEKHVTVRYTENAEAYQEYIQGRYYWSLYTRKGIEKAIQHFRNAIDLDTNYALAYSAIVDCYLRLATNYVSPNGFSNNSSKAGYLLESQFVQDLNSKVKLRFEWDWKAAERELRRANELKTDYPAAHQWHAAYKIAQGVYDDCCTSTRQQNQTKSAIKGRPYHTLPAQIASLGLTPSEQVQVYCTIAREQIDSGNYEGACRILSFRWSFGAWPKLDGLNQPSCADLLFTAGALESYVANTIQVPRGQKHAEQLLNGSIALFEQLGFRRRAAEGRIELAYCYYRQGLFDIGRSTLNQVLEQLSHESTELRGLALIRLAILERHAGRLNDALSRLIEATPLVEVSGPWTTARCYLELASTYKDLAVAETGTSYYDRAKYFYFKALSEFEAIGHHRYVAVVDNNLGFLLLSAGFCRESEEHLLRSLRSFNFFSDSVAAAQVNETLARLNIETKQYSLAEKMIKRAIRTLERTDGEALLAEAVTTSGLVAARQNRYNEAKKCFEAAYNIASRCGDIEGAGRAILIMLEELKDILPSSEKAQLWGELKRLFASTQQKALQTRMEKLAQKCD